jgi:hypothetical protein
MRNSKQSFVGIAPRAAERSLLLANEMPFEANAERDHYLGGISAGGTRTEAPLHLASRGTRTIGRDRSSSWLQTWSR